MVCVEFNKVIQRKGACLAVRHTVKIRKRKRAGMAPRCARVGKGNARRYACRRHFFARLQIVWIIIRAFQIFKNQFCAVNGTGGADRLVQRAPVTFNRVAQHVQAGGGGNLRRNGKGQFGVYDRCFRIHCRVIHRRFQVLFRVRQHGNIRYFACRAARCGERDHRYCLCGADGFSAGVVRFNHVIALCDRACRLAAVHRGSAAERNGKIRFRFPKQSGAVVYVFCCRVWPYITENGFDPAARMRCEFLRRAVFFKTSGADEHAAFSLYFLNVFFQFFAFSAAENDFNRQFKFPDHVYHSACIILFHFITIIFINQVEKRNNVLYNSTRIFQRGKFDHDDSFKKQTQLFAYPRGVLPCVCNAVRCCHVYAAAFCAFRQ